MTLLQTPMSDSVNHTVLHLLHTSGSVCSENGACRYSDPSGNMLPSCTISDVHCLAMCVCSNGYGGKDCSLDAASLTARNAIR